MRMFIHKGTIKLPDGTFHCGYLKFVGSSTVKVFQKAYINIKATTYSNLEKGWKGHFCEIILSSPIAIISNNFVISEIKCVSSKALPHIMLKKGTWWKKYIDTESEWGVNFVDVGKIFFEKY